MIFVQKFTPPELWPIILHGKKTKIMQMKQQRAIIDKPNLCLCSAHKIGRSYFSFITIILGCLLLALKPIYAFESERQGLSDSWVG